MDHLNTIKDYLKDELVGLKSTGKNRYFIEIEPRAIRKAAGFMSEELGMRFIMATSVDEKESLDLMYFFSDDDSDIIYIIKIVLDRKRPVVESISGIVSGAIWSENEISDLMGISFEGLPPVVMRYSEGDKKKRTAPLRKDGM